MDVLEAIKKRNSIRDFKSEPIPQKTLREILAIACRAPSGMNTQPWEFCVITGKPLAEIRRGNIEQLLSGAPPRLDHHLVSWPSESGYRKRQVDLAIELFRLMGISREDKEKRLEWMQRGFRYFNAPAVIIIMADKVFGENWPYLDLGAVAQTLCLVALAFGLGTCIEDQGIMYPDIVKKIAGIPDTKSLMACVAIGYPNEEFPANKIKTAREPIDSLTTWRGFD